MIPTQIIIHHSATADSGTLSWGAIRQYHLRQGWADIGYHAGVEFINGHIECLYGRPDHIPGAHCRGENGDSLGFCFVGNFDKRLPPEALITIACRRVIVPWLLTYNLTPEDIRAHREFSSKTCPGAMFEIDRLQSIAAEIMEG